MKKFLLPFLFLSSIALAQGFIQRLDIGNIDINGNTISTTNTNGDLTFNLNGSGAMILSNLNATTVPYLDANKKLLSSTTTPTQLGFLSSITSSLCGITDSCIFTNKSIDGLNNTLTNINASKIGTRSVSTAAPSSGNLLNWNNTTSTWEPTSSPVVSGFLLTNVNAANVATGTLSAARLPNPTASTLGGVESLAAVSHNFLTSISTSGVPTQAQPVCADLSNASASCSTDATNAANISTGLLAVARGGTGIGSGTSGGIPYYSGSGTIASSAALTSHALMIGGGAAATPYTLASNGSSTQCLISGGASADPAWGPCSGAGNVAPSVQKFLTTGTQTGWVFTVSSANATLGATYTNNANTYTVQGTISAGTTLFMSGTGATSGTTLTKSGGTGDATITFSTKLASATYTTPTSPAPIYIRVRTGGGGGSGGVGDGGSAGNPGTTTYFGSNILTAGPGSGGGAAGNPGGAGGTATIAAGPLGIGLSGGSGNGAGESVGTQQSQGGGGGSNAFGGAGGGAPAGSGGGGLAGAANTGGGGGGGNSAAANASNAGSGGGAGAFIDVIITSPAATYPYVVGTGGASGGAAGKASGAGGTGLVEVTEYYQ